MHGMNDKCRQLKYEKPNSSAKLTTSDATGGECSGEKIVLMQTRTEKNFINVVYSLNGHYCPLPI